jgi:hypothetical protein
MKESGNGFLAERRLRALLPTSVPTAQPAFLMRNEHFSKNVLVQH